MGDGKASEFLERERPASPGNNPREDPPKEIAERERAGETARKPTKPADPKAPSPGPTSVRCRRCSVENTVGASYCRNCGLKLSRNSIRRKIVTALKWLIGSSLILALMATMAVTTGETGNHPIAGGTTLTQGRGVPTTPGEDARGYMLELVNAERISRGIPPVKLGENRAAQLHAEAGLEGCYSGHWDRWGLKPNHRYTLAGGTGAESENVSGRDTCIREGDGYRKLGPLRDEVRSTVNRLMNSRGHRGTMLNPTHTVLNVGIAHDDYNVNMVQQFSSDYVTYQRVPELNEDGILRFQASAKQATFDIGDFANILVYYDPPPGPLTRAQIYQTYSYCNGPLVAYIVWPRSNRPAGGTLSVEKETVTNRCTDPYSVSPIATATNDPTQAAAEWVDIKIRSLERKEIDMETHRVAATELDRSDDQLTVTANLQQVLADNGPGIYSVMLMGKPDHTAETTALSERAIFWQTDPPEGNPYRLELALPAPGLALELTDRCQPCEFQTPVERVGKPD